MTKSDRRGPLKNSTSLICSSQNRVGTTNLSASFLNFRVNSAIKICARGHFNRYLGQYQAKYYTGVIKQIFSFNNCNQVF